MLKTNKPMDQWIKGSTDKWINEWMNELNKEINE